MQAIPAGLRASLILLLALAFSFGACNCGGEDDVPDAGPEGNGENGGADSGFSTDAGPNYFPDAGGCVEDGWESNDSRAEATPLTVGDSLEGQLCGGNDDWYSFSVNAGCSIDVRLDFDLSGGDLDLLLADPDGNVLDASDVLGDSEQLYAQAGETGTHTVRVHGPGTADVTYTLLVNVVCAADLTCPADDNAEDNDSLETATPLFDQTPAEGIICLDDDDYYVLGVTPGCVLEVDLLFTDDDGNLSMEFLLPDGTETAASRTLTDDEHAVDVVTSAGTPIVRVYGVGSAENTYRIIAQELCAGAIQCPQPDPFEPNATTDEASRLDATDEAIGTICGEDEDHFRFFVSAGCSLEVTIEFSDAEGDLDLRLLDSGDNVVDSSLTTTDNEIVSTTAGASGAYYAKVTGFGEDSSNRYHLYAVETCP
jgi:hypothetical protein